MTLIHAPTALQTDRYQLTMLAAYAHAGLASRRAVFELFVRKLPPCRRYMVACGIGRALEVLSKLRITTEDLDWLDRDPFLGPALAEPRVRAIFEGFRFRGRVSAIAEGRICFPGEPLVRVEGTLAEAQMIETLLLSIVNHDTRVASKASRIADSAQGRACFEFGTRRTHEHAAVDAARAAYIAGFAGTSNEEAGRRYGVPVSGTMAHSFVLAHAADGGEEGETRAFEAFAQAFQKPTTCLIDTFDALVGVERAVDGAGALLGGVRIDSGDLAVLAKGARAQLDRRGATGAKIVLSDDLDETRIAALLRAEVPVDVFGVGTMAVSTPDAPSLGAVYKLVALEDARGQMIAVQKRSLSKGSSAGPKQVWRRRGTLEDRVGRADERFDDTFEPLLETLLDDGGAQCDRSLTAARARFVADLACAPAALRSLDPRADSEGFPVQRTAALDALQAAVARDGRVAL